MNIKLNENLGNYFKCIQGIDQKRWYTKEIYQQKHLCIRQMPDQNLVLLKRCVRGRKFISNIPSYDILFNQRYADAFAYAPIDQRKENETSNLVARALYLGEDKTHDWIDKKSHKRHSLIVNEPQNMLQRKRTAVEAVLSGTNSYDIRRHILNLQEDMEIELGD